jgi:hypothetical protein
MLSPDETTPREPDAITQAVGAGVRAFCQSLDSPRRNGHVCVAPCLLCREGVPDAIVAFLRALPAYAVGTGLADEVERAAKGGGDE